MTEACQSSAPMPASTPIGSLHVDHPDAVAMRTRKTRRSRLSRAGPGATMASELPDSTAGSVLRSSAVAPRAIS